MSRPRAGRQIHASPSRARPKLASSIGCPFPLPFRQSRPTGSCKYSPLESSGHYYGLGGGCSELELCNGSQLAPQVEPGTCFVPWWAREPARRGVSSMGPEHEGGRASVNGRLQGGEANGALAAGLLLLLFCSQGLQLAESAARTAHCSFCTVLSGRGERRSALCRLMGNLCGLAGVHACAPLGSSCGTSGKLAS